MSRFRKVGLVTGLAAALLLVFGTAANAVIAARTGGSTDKHFFVHQTDPFVTSSTVYTTVPGADVTVTVPTGGRRIVDVRYSAESFCTGLSGGWCSVRIIVVYPNNATLELDPVVGTDFAFDSVGDAGEDGYEAHAMERSSQALPAGTYHVRVQAALVSGPLSFRLDNWSMVVETINP